MSLINLSIKTRQNGWNIIFWLISRVKEKPQVTVTSVAGYGQKACRRNKSGHHVSGKKIKAREKSVMASFLLWNVIPFKLFIRKSFVIVSYTIRRVKVFFIRLQVKWLRLLHANVFLSVNVMKYIEKINSSFAQEYHESYFVA